LESESASRRRAEDADSASRRQQAELQTKQQIAHRQAETRDWISDYQSRSIAALYLLMQLAGERLSNRVVRVKQQVSAAKTLRSEVTDQLSAVQRLLAEALGVVEEPTPAEQAEQAAQEQLREQAQREQAEREQAEHSQRVPPSEQAAPAGAADDIPSPQPAGSPDKADKSGRGRAASPQQEQTVRMRRPQPADQPTARFGLHP
jgi:hypothetical protein